MTIWWDASSVLPWILVAFVSTCLSVMIPKLFLRNARRAKHVVAWDIAISAGMALFGFTFGSIGWFFFLPGDRLNNIVLYVVLAVSISGAGAQCAPRPTVAASMIGAYSLTLIATILSFEQAPYSVLCAGLVVLYIFVVAAYSRAIWKISMEMVAGEFQRDALIADLKIARSRAEADKERADAANNAKSEFLAMMSHEIRTPMNGVLGMTSVLLDSELSQEQRKNATTIRQSAESLLEIINDVLDLSKLDAQAMEFENIAFDLERLLEYVQDIVSLRMKAKGLNFTITYGTGTPKYIFSDPSRLRQVVLNLLGNAAKFTERGSVTLAISSVDLVGGAARLRMEVRDTGIGIPSHRLDRLFQVFSQADASMSRKYGGTGLGLIITKRIVEGMAGSIGVSSIENKGSTFWFEVPVLIANATDVERSGSQIHSAQLSQAFKNIQSLGRPLRMLVAEDNATNQLVVKSVLAKYDIVPDIVANGLEAISALQHRNYDVVLMDVHMPEMDGLTAARTIRGLDSEASKVPIIALTANAFSHDVENCLNAGMNLHVGKPFKSEELLAAIGMAIGGQDQVTRSKSVERSPHADSNSLLNLDWEALVRFQNDAGREAFDLLIDTFVSDATVKLQQLRSLTKASAGGPYVQTAIRIAHSLKSAASMAGASKMSDTASRLECKLIANEAVDIEMDSQLLSGQFDDYRAALLTQGVLKHAQ